MKDLLGEEADPFFHHLIHQPPRAGLRWNPLKTTREELERLLSLELSPLPWAHRGSLIGVNHNLGKHPLHVGGLFYLQEPSAMAAVTVLDPQPGEIILDLAGAPGGKATQIASRLKNQGLLVANDPHAGRVHALAQNLERWGARNVLITQERPKTLAEGLGPRFDRVLVDAPCSGEGMFRSHPGEKKRWSEGFVKRCASDQNQILWYAAQLVKPGGVLVYSTCTFAPEENEARVKQFLAAREDFYLESMPHLPGFSPGRPDWVDGPQLLERTVRIWPHRAPGEGHFLARMRRADHPERKVDSGTLSTSPLSGDALASYQKFVSQALHLDPSLSRLRPEQNRLMVLGDRLFAVPSSAPNAPRIRWKRAGWHLGTFQKGIFIPSHALALGLKAEQARSVIKFSVGDQTILRFFRGLDVSSTGAPGWVLALVEGHPVGWGRRSKGQVTGNLPRWLRQF